MKKIIRLTESELRNIISNSVRKIIREDVLGDDWRENEEDTNVMNNYEPFETQMEDDPFEGMYGNEHDWGTQGEEEFDPTYYDDPDQYRDDVIGGVNDSPSDNDLYNGRW